MNPMSSGHSPPPPPPHPPPPHPSVHGLPDPDLPTSPPHPPPASEGLSLMLESQILLTIASITSPPHLTVSIEPTTFSFGSIKEKQSFTLKIEGVTVSDRMLEEHIGSLSMLTTIDISYCLNVSWRGIEVIGKHCKNLLQLRRNIPPPGIDMGSNNFAAADNVDELEAMAIAGSMPGLERLELAFGRFSDQGLLAVVTKCKLLRVLDIRGCWNVKMHGDLGLLCDTIPSFKDPWEDEYEIPDSPADEGGNAPQPLMENSKKLGLVTEALHDLLEQPRLMRL